MSFHTPRRRTSLSFLCLLLISLFSLFNLCLSANFCNLTVTDSSNPQNKANSNKTSTPLQCIKCELRKKKSKKIDQRLLDEEKAEDTTKRDYDYVCTKCKYSVTDRKSGRCVDPGNLKKYQDGMHTVGGIPHCEGSLLALSASTNKRPLSTPPSCFMCQEGYSLLQEGFGLQTSHRCVKSNIKMCVVSETPLGGKEQCFVCQNGYPNKELTKCIQKVQELDQNCYYGMRNLDFNSAKPFCAVCKSKYALVPKEHSLGKTVTECGRTAEKDEKDDKKCPFGCARCEKDSKDSLKCVWCNHYQGFYMAEPNLCLKIGRIIRHILFSTGLIILGLLY